MLKIRIEGLPDEVQEGIEKVKNVFNILSCSEQYQNRNSRYVRAYLDVVNQNNSDK